MLIEGPIVVAYPITTYNAVKLKSLEENAKKCRVYSLRSL